MHQACHNFLGGSISEVRRCQSGDVRDTHFLTLLRERANIFVPLENVWSFGLELDSLVAGEVTNEFAKDHTVCQRLHEGLSLIRIDLASISLVQPPTQLALNVALEPSSS